MLEQQQIFKEQQKEIENNFKRIEEMRNIIREINEQYDKTLLELYTIHELTNKQKKESKHHANGIKATKRYLAGLLGTESYIGKGNYEEDMKIAIKYKKLNSEISNFYKLIRGE